jgi:kynurenine formamidase
VTAWPPAGCGARIVDLTHPLAGQAPAYPGQPAGQFRTVATVAEAGFLMSEIHSRSHVGTHADSPAHFLADGETTFTIGVERWMGGAWIARLPGACGPIGASMLTLPLEPAQVLLIATGHSRFWGTERYYRHAPYLTVDAAERIIAAGFGLVGLDFGSPDETGSRTEPCHHALLGAGVLIIENLNGLDSVGGDWCWFCAAPLLIGGGDGGFCRAFAAVPP